MADQTPWLRTQPRQQRSLDRIEILLDTTEEVFGEIGYDKATTNLIAERARIPVGTLYRWFPDKAALAEGLAARYLTRLTETYARRIADAPPRTGMIRVAIGELAELVKQNPALPVIISKASVSGTGELLRDTLQESAAQMIRTLVPTVEQADLDRITRMLTTVTFAVFHDALTRDDQQFREAVEEFSDLVVAWMRARFPPADDPVWDGDDPVVTPLAPSPAASLRQDPPEGTRPDPTSR